MSLILFIFNKEVKYLGMKDILIKFAKTKGALAHLARAFDWQSRGDEFESRMLHPKA